MTMPIEIRNAWLARLRDPEAQKITHAYFPYFYLITPPLEEKCACALGHLIQVDSTISKFYGQGNTKAKLMDSYPEINFPLIVQWNDEYDLSLPEIADKIEKAFFQDKKAP